MCGIAGIVHADGRPLDGGDELVLRAMGATIRHRGPDGEAIEIWRNVGFVFERLSIVDLEGGMQPFTTADGSVTAMVNGEIYNHRAIRASLSHQGALRTQSDCEVIPYLYLERGERLFDPVNGMFAVALLDRTRHRVLLARDRLGIKPLFYAWANGGTTFVFGSEIKALLAHPGVSRRFDWRAGLAQGFFTCAPALELPSHFEGIERLPAGSLLTLALDTKEATVKTYWSIPARVHEDAALPESSFDEQFRELICDSVRLRLMADVRCGVFLSGGIDSSVVAAIAAKHSPVPTFSVHSRSTIENGDAAAAAEVAAALGLPHHSVAFDLDGNPFGADDWRRVLWACELPTITAEQLYKFHLHAFAGQRYPDLKVILLGQGSDEFLGGYLDKFVPRREVWRDDDWDAAGFEIRKRELAQRARLQGVEASHLALFERGVLDRDYVARASGDEGNETTWDRYARACRQNLDYHLWHEDRTAAAHAIENRVPFIDYRIVELLASIPARLQASAFCDKRMLRRVARSLVPAHIAQRPKGYFFYGQGQHHAFRMMHELLMQDRGGLIEQAIEGSRRTGGPLAADGFREFAAGVGRDGSYADLTHLLVLANMGILAEMASGAGCASAESRAPVVREVAAAAITAEAFADTMVVALALDVSLVEMDSDGSSQPARHRWYLATGGRPVAAVESPGWQAFLAAIDGQRTIAQIAAEQRLNLARTRKWVREALDRKLLVRIAR